MSERDNPHKGHRGRVRRRILNGGWGALCDHELVEFLLFYAIPRQDTNEIAHKAISEFGTLSRLLEAAPGEIMARLGLSETAALLISSVLPIYKRYRQDKQEDRPALNNSAAAGRFCSALFMGETREHLYVVCLDAQRRVIGVEHSAAGTVNEAHVYPREVADAAMRRKASSVVITHNHPSGMLAASSDDIALTRGVVSALSTLDIDVIDHVICGGEGFLSFADKGLLNMGY